MNIARFQTEFDKMMNRDYFSEKVHPMRQEAFIKFLKVGIPTKKMGRLATHKFIFYF
jgi:hypothetical protein